MSMKVIVKARHMHLTSALRAYAEDKLGAAVMRVFDCPAATLEIELQDLGHVRGGLTKECRVVVFMPKGKTIVICETDDDMYKAIDLAHHRLLLQVKREQERKKKATQARKYAARYRALVTQQNFTARPERWEQELHAYERSTSAALHSL